VSVGIDTFGFDAVQTLARVADPTPAPDHSAFWARWTKRVHADRPELVERVHGGSGTREPDPSDPTATHAFASLGVRIGARLQLPPEGTPVRAGLVSTHGYAASLPVADRDPLFADVVSGGVAVLNIRVRGFAGSRLDCGDLTEPEAPGLGWLTRGLAHANEAHTDTVEGCDGWSYAGAVADVFNACRALRQWLDAHARENAHLYLHGESFGGGSRSRRRRCSRVDPAPPRASTASCWGCRRWATGPGD
jgi:cephalosporin-C deacetylase-like acetyl esterase